MNCTTCGSKLKQLFSSWYCPKDCDCPISSSPSVSGDSVSKIYTYTTALSVITVGYEWDATPWRVFLDRSELDHFVASFIIPIKIFEVEAINGTKVESSAFGSYLKSGRMVKEL